MAHRWDLRCPPPTRLFVPVAVGTEGGPTRSQTRGSRWRRSSPGRYVPASVDRTVEQRILEAAQRLPDGGAVSGWAALRLAGANFCDGLASDGISLLPVPLVGPPESNFRTGPDCTRHRQLLDESEIVIRYGVPCTVVERALLDAARWAPDIREAVVVVDIALAAGLSTSSTLASYADLLGQLPGAALLRRSVRLAVNRSRSPNESRMRLIWQIDGRFPAPRCNWPVADLTGRRIGRPDLLCEQLAVIGEFDGFDHSGASARSTDAGKESDYRDAGFELFRVTGRDLARPDVVLRRMRAAVARAGETARPRRWLLAADPGPL
ncbi:hypothetical protein ACVW00_001367 [Marmoricola sp. URHA0025 HA25]